LLESGADISARDDAGASALHRAAGRGNERIAHLLLEHGANIAALDRSRYTPLDVATSVGNANVVRLLLEKGADPNTEDAVEDNQDAPNSPEWPELKIADAGVNNPEGMAHNRLTKLLEGEALYPLLDDLLGEQ
jgi:ankyrin repeat protein